MNHPNRELHKVVLIAGPTASGKSTLALRLAELTGAAILNADSMQVYRELRVLSARPGPDDEARAQHLLYGHIAAVEPYSVADWLGQVGEVLDELATRDIPAIIVGGTGLYFKALTEGLSSVPPVNEAVRVFWRKQAERLSGEALHGELAARDPLMAKRLQPSDTQRVLRAIEVIESSGRSLGTWQGARGIPLLRHEQSTRVVIAPDRRWLHSRIDSRFDAMMCAGALEEARALVESGLDPSISAMRAIGVRPLAEAARGTRNLGDAIERAKTETRQYAKRQETWFRNQMADWERVPPQDLDATAEAIARQMDGNAG